MITKYSELCVGNTYYTVCASDLDEADLKYICVEGEFQNGSIVPSEGIQDKLYQPITSFGISNIDCPDSSKDFDSSTCSFTVSRDHCESNGGPSITSCVYQGKVAILTPKR